MIFLVQYHQVLGCISTCTIFTQGPIISLPSFFSSNINMPHYFSGPFSSDTSKKVCSDRRSNPLQWTHYIHYTTCSFKSTSTPVLMPSTINFWPYWLRIYKRKHENPFDRVAVVYKQKYHIHLCVGTMEDGMERVNASTTVTEVARFKKFSPLASDHILV